MRLDAHQHFWYYNTVDYAWISEAMPQLKQHRLPPDLQPHLEANNFAGCVAVQARQSLAETDFLLSLAAQYDYVKAVVGWVDLRDSELSTTLESYRDHTHLKGFRHIVQDEPDDRFLLRSEFIRGVQLLGQHGYTYDVLVYEKQLPHFVTFLDHCPDQPFVLDHLGKPQISGGPSSSWRAAIRAIAQHPQVYCKVSGLVTEAEWFQWKAEDFEPFLDIVLEAFGPQRLMLGSDWPVCLLAAKDYDDVLQIMDRFTSGMTPEEKEGIYGKNAQAFYKIEQHES